MQYHVSDSYTTPFGDARINYYRPPGTPCCWFGGMLEAVGAYPTVSQTKSWYMGLVNQRRNVPTDIRMEMFASVTNTRQYAIDTIVYNEGTSTMTMRLYTVQVLDRWPATGGYHRNGCKLGTSTLLTLGPGQSTIVTTNLFVDSQSWNSQEDIKFISWAQEDDPRPPAQIYNAAEISYPFPHGCLKGRVNLAASTVPEPVLTINGNAREVTISQTDPMQVFMTPAPAGPSPGPYAVYMYNALPDETTITPHPKRLGDFCFPTPITGGAPEPVVIWNNIGRRTKVGFPDFPSVPAPSVVYDLPGGVGTPLEATFVGFIMDNASAANKPASITNGVRLFVQ